MRVLRADPLLLASQAAIAAGLAAALVLTIVGDGIFAFSDAPSHVITARRVWDNGDASIAQLGTHWTPLYHMLQLPFVWLDGLYSSGASAIALSVAASFVSALFLYKLAVLVTGDPVRGFAAAAMLAASPSFLYFGVIPMLPATVMAATTANVYFLTRWVKDGRGMSLLAAGLTLTLATLAHFDTWVLAPAELAVVIAFAHWRWRARERTEATTLLWLVAGGYGIAVFLVMNVMIYGDPLAFLSGYSEANGASGSAGESRSGFDRGLRGLLDYPHAAWLNAGPALAAVGAIGLLGTLVRRGRSAGDLVPLLLLYPLAWYSFQAAAAGSYIVPDEQLSDWVNLRYGVTLLPALAYFAATGLPRRAGAIAGVAVAVAGGAFMLADNRVASWEDAIHDLPADRTTLRPAADWISERTGGTRVFLPVHHRLIDRFQLETGLDLRGFVDSNDNALYEELRSHPERARAAGVGWIVWLGEGGAPVVDRAVRLSGAHRCYEGVSGRAELPRVRIYSLAPGCGEPVRGSAG